MNPDERVAEKYPQSSEQGDVVFCKSYWVNVTYQRPFQGKTMKFVRAVKRALEEFLFDPLHVPCNMIVNDNVDFEIRLSRPPGTAPTYRYELAQAIDYALDR